MCLCLRKRLQNPVRIVTQFVQPFVRFCGRFTHLPFCCQSDRASSYLFSPGFAKEEMAASIGLIGLVIAARYIGTMIFDVPAGILVGRIGLRKTMVAGVLLFGIAAIWAGMSPNFSSLMAARLLAGASYALWSISRHSYIASAVPMDVRGRALALFGGLSRIATILGPLIGGILASLLGSEFPFTHKQR
ncbi:MAG: hypothetical protein Ct9H300mP19_02010 [Dehalococcoidia bacterium]|nr:MAG: hypothetical protein Ct9H300mP19_02010 [Dehalococcoidia bacterium]